jgi:hypothetical protein
MCLSSAIHSERNSLFGRARQSCQRFAIGPVAVARCGGRCKIRLVSPRHAGVLEQARLVRGCLQCLQWAGVGVLALIPVRLGTVQSDGYSQGEVLAGGAALDRVERALLTSASHATPFRVRDWPNELICRLGHDRTDPRTAGEYLDRLTADRPPSDPPEYALEAAFFHARYRDDIASARTRLDSETREAEPWVRLRVRAAVERCAGNWADAGNLIDSAIAAIRCRTRLRRASI